MSNWCNRNTLEYRRYQNDPDYEGLPDWFIVAPGSSSDVLLTDADGTTPRRYLTVPPGQNVVVEKDQAGKDQADANLRAEQEASARAATDQLFESELEPVVMLDRSSAQVGTDSTNELAVTVNSVLQSVADNPNSYSQMVTAIGQILPVPTVSYAEQRGKAKAKVDSGAVDAPALEGT